MADRRRGLRRRTTHPRDEDAKIMAEAELFDRLQQLVLKLDQEGLAETTREALAAGLSAQDIISKGLAPGMEAVGRGYEEGELFVPELMMSARAMLAALDLVRPHLARQGLGPPGKVVLGTVQGDIHQIGKNIVSVVLEGDGFEVHDLGEDVPPQAFVDKAQEVGADVVGISALISLAVSKMAETVALLKQGGIPAKVIVGGAAVTRETAENIGADAHGRDAWEALRRVRRLVQGELQT
jgi:methanogenic corrinoid protein MtbC1